VLSNILQQVGNLGMHIGHPMTQSTNVAMPANQALPPRKTAGKQADGMSPAKNTRGRRGSNLHG